MSEDIFDIVDGLDSVVASAPRSEVHARGLRHRAAHVLMFCGSGAGRKILLQKRSASKDSYPLAYTTSCSGHVDSGEDYDAAAVREMREETGLEVDISRLKKIGKISACPETGNEFTFATKWSAPETKNFRLRPPRSRASNGSASRSSRLSRGKSRKNSRRLFFAYTIFFYRLKTPAVV